MPEEEQTVPEMPDMGDMGGMAEMLKGMGGGKGEDGAEGGMPDMSSLMSMLGGGAGGKDGGEEPDMASMMSMLGGMGGKGGKGGMGGMGGMGGKGGMGGMGGKGGMGGGGKPAADDGERDSADGTYIWEQKGEEVQIRFKEPAGLTKKDVKVMFKTTKIKVELKGEVVMEGELKGAVEPDECCWTLDADTKQLQVMLTKKQEAAWSSVLA